MAILGSESVSRHRKKATLSARTWALLALVLMALLATGCYNNNTGEANIGGAVNFTLPAFPETGSHAVEVFTEMHYQPSYRSQERPRLLPPPDSVPVTGRELTYASLEDYQALKIPDKTAQTYDPGRAAQLYAINCTVCHGPTLRGSAEENESAKAKILEFMENGPFPADLTSDLAASTSDGELFGFLTGGGRQGLAASLRGIQSASPMPEYKFLLTEEDRWALVQFLRAQIGR